MGRDIGINLSGGFVSNKLKYRLGAFAGRRDFENQPSAPLRVIGLATTIYDKLNTTTVFGGGLNYFFNGYTTNVRLSYVAMTKGVEITPGEIKNKTYGQVWLQLQLCLF